MTLLSTRAKEAIKTALSMTLSYGIALGMGWDNPMWAGFSVAMISLSTTEQSLSKGIYRMLGTLLAVIAALTLLALFAQDRWLFMLALSLYVGFCTYMVTGKRYPYFWFVSAFVCMIIAFESGGQSLHAFNTAMLRAQETGLGILVYTLITTFLWPQHDDSPAENTDQSGHEHRHRHFVLDTERLQAALRVMLTLWVAFIVWVYIDPPGHTMFMFLTTTFALVAVMYRVNPGILLMPFLYGSIITGLLYVFVMPQLSGYAELGALIFTVTFLSWYVFSKPAQRLLRMAIVVAFLVLASIQNEQSYSFASYANSVAMILLASALAIAVSYVPISIWRPDKTVAGNQ